MTLAYITVRAAAARWGISRQRVTVLCREGRIRGAIQPTGPGGGWAIPADARKPAALRPWGRTRGA